MKIVHPPVSVAQFLGQTYADAEYWRRYIPGTLKQYSSRDGDTGKRCHAGYDINDTQGDRILDAAFDGRVDHHYDAALGYIVRLIDEKTGEGLWYCHCAKRYAADGSRVKAGTKIALMGETGQTKGVHLHLAGTRVWNDYGTLFNYGPQLRALKEGLMPLNEQDLNAIRAIIRDEAGKAAAATAKNTVLALLDGRDTTYITPDFFKTERQKYNLRKIVEKP